ncbi:MAG: phosphoadenylyl-sulfate reductase [Acidobacteriales bacterium]|nr:phosphoadenylyl-sulfate reductase [Terriglobales bacterium]
MPELTWLHTTQAFAESWGAEEILDWSLHRFDRQIAMASGFGIEGIVLIDMAVQLRPDIRVFTLDTGLLFPETYELMEKIERRYGIEVERLKPALTVAEQERQHGPALWLCTPDRCCYMRKVEPLRAKLSTLGAWITAIRRDQTPDRAQAQKVEWDAKFGLVKINPLCDWTSGMVWDYVRKHRLPYNRLHDQGYPSIGCTPCTRPVAIGEDPRSGRWANFVKTECGLHQRVPPEGIVPVL